MRRPPALVLLAAVASAAAGPVVAQPAPAETADGRRVLLFDDGGWVDADEALEPQRGGQRLRSASGLYTVHVPAGWTVAKSKGPAVEDEFTFEHASTGLNAATFFIAWDDLFGGLDLALTTESALALFWAGMASEGEAAVTDPARVVAVGDRRFSTVAGTVRFPGEPRLAVRLTAAALRDGLVAAMTFADPLAPEGAAAVVDAFHRSLAVHGPAPPGPGGGP